jgi:hypothetical protein
MPLPTLQRRLPVRGPRKLGGGGDTAGALDERPGGGAGVARGGGAPQPEVGAAGGGRDARADAARAAPTGQPAPARLMGASSVQGRHWSFRRWRLRRCLQRGSRASDCE